MVTVMVTSSDTVVSTRAVGVNPEGMDYSSVNGQIYVANADVRVR